ncbi:MAG: hypothetical protein JWP94_3271 [Mucilaginibacter sp.]|jgi:hypothetical protein|nr:hypothetical protein [Mucilaginibacter sp.]
MFIYDKNGNALLRFISNQTAVDRSTTLKQKRLSQFSTTNQFNQP